jgi:large subunit ribosomal protein L10
MDNPRAEKVAVVDEVRQRLEESAASVVTEYRGLTVADLAELRRNLRAAGGDYKVFKNTLVRLAIAGGPHQPLEDLLTGPTAITFVQGDVSAVAKALREFSRANPHLIVKGGLIAGDVLSSGELGALADLPSRDVLLARFAGALQAPLAQLAGLLQALPRDFAYGLSALLDEKGGAPEASAPAAEADAPAEVAAPEAEAAPESEADGPAEAAAPEAAAADATAPEAAVDAEAEADPAPEAPAEAE